MRLPRPEEPNGYWVSTTKKADATPVAGAMRGRTRRSAGGESSDRESADLTRAGAATSVENCAKAA